MSQDSPVILQILPALENGGVERGVIDIAKHLKKNQATPIVASAGGILCYELQEEKILHIKLNLNSKNPFQLLKNYQQIINIIKEHQVDIVHVRSRAPMWSAYYACKKTKTKLVSTVHGFYSLKFLFWQVFSLKKKYNAIMLQADQIIAVSNCIKNYILQNYNSASSEKITVIQRGADLDYFHPTKISKNRIIDLIKKWNLPEDKKIILMPARITSWKGHDFLLDALLQVKNDFFCVLVGSAHGHEKFRDKLEYKIIEKNLAGKVCLVGVCQDISVAYQLAHFVVAPSIRPEAFGRVAIEAQASAKPIIATNIGGSLETIIDNQTGFLVEPNNVSQLASIIDKLLEMPKEEIDKIGNAGRIHIQKNFSNQLMSDKTWQFYQKFLSEKINDYR
jgi:glycosyltransferase involved in cell wall biosynthesis